MLAEDSYYLKEKRKGGENSYQKYKPLRDKVKSLCEEELGNQSYSSASQLCETVADRIVDENPELLRSFEPHKTHAHSGNDWKRPTFYLWCNEVYKGLQNTSTLIDD